MTENEWYYLEFNKPSMNEEPTIGSVVEIENIKTLHNFSELENIDRVRWYVKTFGKRWYYGSKYQEEPPVWHPISEEPAQGFMVTVEVNETQIVEITDYIVPGTGGKNIALIIKDGTWVQRWRYVGKSLNSKIANISFNIDLSKVILWQYDQAERLKQLIDYQKYFMNIALFNWKNEFDKNLFNLNSCDTNGLDLWGRLLNSKRPVRANGTEFSDKQYRTVLKAKISLLVNNGSGADLNKFFKSMFPEIRAMSIDDNLNMTVSIDIADTNLSTETKETIQYIIEHINMSNAGVLYLLTYPGSVGQFFGFEGMTEARNMGEEGNTNPDAGTFYN